ncbi:MAG TPA: glutathione peroxidase [Acidobacteriaceae bacterium]
MSTLASIPLTTLTGAPTSLADYSGKVLLIVNVASKCGLTPQYTGLEALYRQFKDRGFVVLGFPANDFASQEPGTNQEIAKFCSTEYPVTFPLFSKIAVNGPEQHPMYTMLTSAMPQHEADAPDFRDNIDNYLSSQDLPPTLPLPAVLWNFEKFLVGRDGLVIARFAPDMKPDDPRIVAAIAKALAA